MIVKSDRLSFWTTEERSDRTRTSDIKWAASNAAQLKHKPVDVLLAIFGDPEAVRRASGDELDLKAPPILARREGLPGVLARGA